MNLYANKRLRVARNVITHVRRQLSYSGDILVSVGQEVVPSDVVGRSNGSAGFRSINLANLLSVSPKEAQKYLQRPFGKPIYKGELLSLKPASLLEDQIIVLSPTDGIIETYDQNTGQLRLQFLPKQIDLPAAVFGVIEEINQQRGEIIIRTEVTQIFGLFGSGKLREGILKVLGERGELVSKSQIMPEYTDHILVGGGLVYSEAISAAAYMGVLGIITGGINAEDYRKLSGNLTSSSRFGTDIGMGFLVCEGFGSIPIGEDIFEILKLFNNQFAILEGNKGRLSLPTCDKDCMRKIKTTKLPDVRIEQMVDPLNEVEAIELEKGQRVRMISSPYMGSQGTVVSIDNAPTLLPSQISTYMITVATSTRKIKVPYTNVEIVG